MLRRMGVTGPQRLALRLVGRFPGLTASGLAALLHLHASTVSGIMKRLERRGLMHRTADPSDRRRARLMLTAAGLEVVAGPHPTIEGAVRELIRDRPAEDLDRTRRLLMDLAERLGSLRATVSSDGAGPREREARPRRLAR